MLIMGVPGVAEEVRARMTKSIEQAQLGFWRWVLPTALHKLLMVTVDAATSAAGGGEKE